jgi:hypothetical protein
VVAALFDFGPYVISVPVLREQIEFKILKDFFIRSYNLPSEFKFSNYMTVTTKNYIIAFIEVQPVTWLTLCFVITMNLFKILLIDPVYKRGRFCFGCLCRTWQFQL